LSGSKRWRVTAWRELLELALGALDEAGQHKWTLGGGTGLALKIDHRVSYDIDLFVEDAAALHALSPNRNRAARGITDLWQEPGNYIKLEHEEGAIDFILAVRQTELTPWLYRFVDREIRVEQPAEIIAKKLRYRGSRLLPRDIFDLLAVQRFDPTYILTAVRAVPDGARRAADRIERIAARYRETIRDEVNPTSTGVDLLDADPLDAARALAAG
jgi:hypothetical protein